MAGWMAEWGERENKRQGWMDGEVDEGKKRGHGWMVRGLS